MNGSAGASTEYAVVLTRRNIDRFEHNVLFARELASAFAAVGVTLRPIDYIAEPRQVLAALRDGECRFFLTFNGFGSELQLPMGSPGRLLPAYSAFNKQLFDLMHDCPAHESMAHQLRSTFPERTLLVTDFGYASVATGMGIPNVLYVPSITFPSTIPAVKPIENRSVHVLLPIGLVPPGLIEDRHSAEGGYKSRLYRSLFYEVSGKASADWRLDPLAELVNACREIGVMLDWMEADDRFLLTTLADHVKFVRRQRLLQAIAHLPVTVMTDRKLDVELRNSRIEFVEARSASGLLSLMAESRCVLCPTPHLTGFHERALGAFTAGAAVVSSPNRVFEADFIHWRDLVFFRNEEEVASIIETLLSEPEQLRSIAENGRARACRLFPPARLVETILSLLNLRVKPGEYTSKVWPERTEQHLHRLHAIAPR